MEKAEGKYINGTKVEDLTGQKFYKLRVVEFAYFKEYMQKGRNKPYRRPYFYCECDCGNEKLVIVSGPSLKSGCVKSCGCGHMDASVHRRKYNVFEIDEKNNLAFGLLGNSQKFVIDFDDLDLIKDYYWVLDNHGYVVSKERVTQKNIRLHNLLCPDFEEVDHKDQDKLNNRKCNFREVTRQENVINRPKPKSNTSGFIGVY